MLCSSLRRGGFAALVATVALFGCSSGSVNGTSSTASNNGSATSSGGISPGISSTGSISASSAGSSSGATSGTTGAVSSGGSSGGVVDAGPPRPAGVACGDNRDCQSQACGLNGICCQQACEKTTGICGASCQVSTGLCEYPDAGQVCAPSLCDQGGYVDPSRCDGLGNCATPPISSCGGLGCLDNTTCREGCVSDDDCVDGTSCDRADAGLGRCTGNLGSGADCSESSNCNSGTCLGGHCCVASCPGTDPVCGASTCDSSGACGPLAASRTTCFPGACDGTNFRAISTCDGLGGCTVSDTTACSPFGCNTDGCLSSCQRDSDCDPKTVGSICGGQQCCSFFSGLQVDGAQGVDTPCCGTGSLTACQTLTYAMHQITAYNQTHPLQPVGQITITATLSDGTSDWRPPAGEQWPVQLSYGVTLQAPGVYFSTGTAASALFRVAEFPGESAASVVTIEGSAASSNPVVIGSDSTGLLTKANAAIEVDGPQSLDLLSAAIFSAACDAGTCDDTSAILVKDGTLTLGLDPTQATGLVQLGGPLPNTLPTVPGASGIRCFGIDGGVFDNAAVGDGNGNPAGPGFSIQGMRKVDVDLQQGCLLFLDNADQFGVPPLQAGLNRCPSKVDTIGIRAIGPSTVAIGGVFGSPLNTSPSVTCQDQYGIQMLADDGGVGPQVSAANLNVPALISNCGCAGIDNAAGQLNLNGVTVEYNQIGVRSEGSGVAAVSASSLACSSKTERSTSCHAAAGIDLLDLTSGPVASVNGNNFSIAGDASGETQRWRCPGVDLSGCTCFGLNCPASGAAIPDHTPVVYLSSDTAIPPMPSAEVSNLQVTCN